MTTAPSRTPAATRAEDWLSSLDDVLGPDDGSDWDDRWDGGDRMRWSAEPGPVREPSKHPIDAWLHRTYPNLGEPIAARSIMVHPDALDRLRQVASPRSPIQSGSLGSFCGMPVLVDPDLPPGTVLVGAEISRAIYGATEVAGRYMVAVAAALRTTTPGLTRLARQMRAAVPPPLPPPSRLDLARQRRVATAMRVRDRRARRRVRGSARRDLCV
jgi:hypothetical protein